MSPTDRALVLCVDETRQILWTAATLGSHSRQGPAATMTHDYKRNGGAVLFSAGWPT
jgi:hypothetical protein